MSRCCRNRHAVENWLPGHGRFAARCCAANAGGGRAVLFFARRIAQVYCTGKRDELESVRFGDRLIVVDVVELSSRQQRRELGGVRSNVARWCMRQQRRCQSRLLIKTLSELKHDECSITDRREIRIGAADLDIRSLYDG